MDTGDFIEHLLKQGGFEFYINVKSSVADVIVKCLSNLLSLSVYFWVLEQILYDI